MCDKGRGEEVLDGVEGVGDLEEGLDSGSGQGGLMSEPVEEYCV